MTTGKLDVDVTVEVDTKVLDRIVSGGLDQVIRDVVGKAAHDVERIAKPLAPWDTGALRSSIHVTTSWGESGYEEAVAAATALRPGVKVWPEVRPSAPRGGAAALIGAAVEYGMYQEFGTSRMAARPHLRPALERVKDPFRRAIEAVLRRLAE